MPLKVAFDNKFLPKVGTYFWRALCVTCFDWFRNFLIYFPFV